MSKVFGYARVSSKGQSLAIQEAALTAAGCAVVFAEKVTGTTDDRPELIKLRAVVGAGDTIVVTRLDRLGRSTRDLQNIAHELKATGAHLRVLEQHIDTSTITGKLFYDMLSAFAEFETALRKERQSEGIEAAKAEGVYKGRKPTARAKAGEAKALEAKGTSRTEIARKLGISRMSVYRILDEAA